MEEYSIKLNGDDVEKLRFAEFQENDISLELVKDKLTIHNDHLLSSHCIILTDEDATLKYTPMQFSAKCGLVKLAKVLLENNIDPNFKDNENLEPKKKKSRRFGLTRQKEDNERGSQSSIRTKDDKASIATKEYCDTYPLLLAAENGHHEIIKLFKYHNFADETKTTSETCVKYEGTANEDVELQKFMPTATPSKFQNVNFKVTNENYQTVLHVVLQQHLLALETNAVAPRTSTKLLKRKITYQNIVVPKNKRLQEISAKYRKCIEALLDIDRFQNKAENYNSYPHQIRSIINDKDVDGNTPLHCAVLNWSEDVIKELLSLGANASIKNDLNEIPLTKISKSAFEEFLNKQCIIVEGFDAGDDEVEEDSEVEDESKVTQDYDPGFMMKISQCGTEHENKMKFDYGFLAPAGTSKQNRNNKDLLRQESGGKRIEKDIEIAGNEENDISSVHYEPEMDLLWAMSQSKTHRSLIIHPVIDSYLWIKWKLMTRLFNRNLRIDALFAYCLIWYIFTHFGGQKWNSVTIVDEDDKFHKYVDKFCQPANFSFKVIDFTNIRLLAYAMFWYYLFCIIFVVLLLLMMRDLRRDIAMYCSQDYTTSQQSPIVASWVDLGTITLSVLTLLGGSDLLWLVITSILIFFVLVELIQIYSLTWKYLVEISNWIDFGIISLAFVILYLPPDLIMNPKIFSIFGGKDDENKQENEDGTVNCRILRCLSAITIVLVSVRFLMSISKLPMLKNYNLYVIMFFKVMKTYIKIMAWYGCYIVAFGLGFYIMLHDDINEASKNKDDAGKNVTGKINITKADEDKNKFRNPLLAVIKTSTMFVGEIEFGDLPIEGGDISVTMIYIFLVLFIFLMIIVLMNLLNGLAVSDTGQMINDSLIESQVSFISTIKFYESIYLGQMENKESGFVKTFIKRHIVPKGILLFHSPYLQRNDKRLTLPIMTKVNEGLNNCLCFPFNLNSSSDYEYGFLSRFCNILVSWYLGKDENEGSEEFLENARNILIDERSKKVEKRRRDNLWKRKKDRRDKKEEMNTKIKSIDEAVKRMSSQSSV